MQKVKIDKVLPDENQPRKNFPADRLATLVKSVKRFGVKTPLIVREHPDKKGFYQIINGERRWRAAKELGIQEIPISIEDVQSEQDLLVMQFHLQHQHEDWSSTEKAMAFLRLCEENKLTINEAVKLLDIEQELADRLIAFSKLLVKKEFEKHNISLSYAKPFLSVVSKAERVCQLNEMSFTLTDRGNLERAMIKRVVNGEITQAQDYRKLKDSFVKDPKSIKRFIVDNKITPESLFVDTKAKSAMYLRMADNVMGRVTAIIEEALKENLQYNAYPSLLPNAKKLELKLRKLIDKMTE